MTDFDGNKLLEKSRAGKTVPVRMADGNTVEIPLEMVKNLSIEDIKQYAAVQAAEAIGSDQFGPILTDKNQLVGEPFVAVKWNFYPGEFGEFVSMWVLTNDDAKYIVNDGSTGICAQLRALTDNNGQDGMLVCPKGLRRSDYKYTDPRTGDERPASTFYIDASL